MNDNEGKLKFIIVTYTPAYQSFYFSDRAETIVRVQPFRVQDKRTTTTTTTTAATTTTTTSHSHFRICERLWFDEKSERVSLNDNDSNDI
jgi:hypothetical protein